MRVIHQKFALKWKICMNVHQNHILGYIVLG
jgi:hypothetical protein